ncbi:formate dehydrogenase accessory sulfurtransferase FdhD [Marinihelvus fidelis]|uniref:Sulfur carrier protein FdhD n=1 Tax=Marinihelvus fidelis TaxID=2613842 RepID=A0A5N0TDR3_9GAMM|nr:formate dehydrogenase accessory sulfurtransferase FdhD [Marinihelvus fidelis]KAA9132818.1 formate dehydrogenase accessory sulfurtransferase FdhD [Marinihelvus fidelis]
MPSAVTTLSRWQDGRLEPGEDLVAGECPVAISFNRRPYVVMMATPANLEELGLGFCLTEGLLDDAGELLASRVIERDQGVELALTVAETALARLDGQRRNLSGRTGCGLCGAETLEQAMAVPPKVGEQLQVSHQALQSALASLEANQPLQAATGAVHCAAWCDAGGRVVTAREDVGRHNALDKLLGWRASAGPGGGFVVVSSRASYEMVHKCAMAGVELLLAVSAPTALAIAYAEHCGLSLVGFARPGRHNIYTAPGRVVNG